MKRNEPSFKETLSQRATNYETFADIEHKMKLVKDGMEDNFASRIYHIHLIESKPNCTVAMGARTSNDIRFFVPKNLPIQYYNGLFLNRLRNLGFEEDDITFSVEEGETYIDHKITVTW